MAAASESAVSRCVNYHRKKIKKTSSAAAAAASPPSPSIATARRPSSHIDGSVEEENTSSPTIATTILALAHVVCTWATQTEEKRSCLSSLRSAATARPLWPGPAAQPFKAALLMNEYSVKTNQNQDSENEQRRRGRGRTGKPIWTRLITTAPAVGVASNKKKNTE